MPIPGFVEGLLDLVLPAECAGCREPSARALCAPCRAALAGARPRRTRPEPEPAGLPATYALAAYGGALGRALVQYKDENRHDLAGPLGRELARVVMRAAGSAGPGSAGVVLVPVPATAAAARKRHGDHMVRLARAAAQCLPGVAVALPLRALPKDGDSAELSAAERARAAEHAFAARGRKATRLGGYVNRSGAVIVLVDDIVTTGVTLVAAARCLAAAGVGADRAAVLAATQRERAVTRNTRIVRKVT